MTNPLASLILLHFALPSLAAPHRPVDMKELQQVLDERTRLIDTKVMPVERTIRRIEQQIGLRDARGKLQTAPAPDPTIEEVSEHDSAAALEKRLGLMKAVREAYANLPLSDKGSYASAMRDMRSLASQVSKLSDRAIPLAQAAYGITPPKSGTIVNGPTPGDPDSIRSFVGREVSWSPAFNATLPSGRNGETEDDCRVKIGPSAYSSAGMLALTLYHEGLHFAEHLTPNIDLRNAPAAEARVRRRVRPYLGPVFRLRIEQIQEHDRIQRREELQAVEWKNFMPRPDKLC